MRAYYEELWEQLPERLSDPDRLLRETFLLAELDGAERVLDLGSGDGHFTELLAAAGVSVVAADVAEAALERVRQRRPDVAAELVQIDAPLPFADGVFDLVWASEVIEHVGDTARWLSEVRRVLAPRGKLLLTTPNHGRLRLLVHGVEPFSEPLGDHLHLYTRRSLAALLEEFGFDEAQIRTAGGAPLWRRLLLARVVRSSASAPLRAGRESAGS